MEDVEDELSNKPPSELDSLQNTTLENINISSENSNVLANSEDHAKVDTCQGKVFRLLSYAELKEYLSRYYEDNSTHFVSMSVSKNFGASTSECDLTGHSVVWQDSVMWYDLKDINIDEEEDKGIPRMIVGKWTLQCQYGKDKSVAAKEKRRRKILEEEMDGSPARKKRNLKIQTKKCDCPAKISIRQIIKFPEYKISTFTKFARSASSKKLRENLKENRQNVQTRMTFVGYLPDISEHQFHTVTLNKEPIHDVLRCKTSELYVQNYSTLEIVKRLQQFVVNELFYMKPPPAESRRMFYPKRKDVSNIIDRFLLMATFTHEQEATLRGLCERLKTTCSEINIHFTLDSEVSNEFVVDTSEEEEEDDQFFEPDQEPKVKKKKNTQPKPKKVPTTPYLICLQNPEQQRLLKRYGDVVYIVRCTDQSNAKKFIPFYLYVVAVQTNVDFQPVTCIIVSKMRKKGLVDALDVFKEWNGFWKPKYFLLDCYEEISDAVETHFAETPYFLTVRSCEAKWREFLNTPSNDLQKHCDHIVAFLKNMALSYSEDVLTVAAALFESSEVWLNSTKLRTWFQSSWLPIAKKWVFGYRPQNMLVLHHHPVSLSESLKDFDTLMINFDGRRESVLSTIEKIMANLVDKCYEMYKERNVDTFRNCCNFKKTSTLTDALRDLPLVMLPHVYHQYEAVNDNQFLICQEQVGLYTVVCETLSAAENESANAVVDVGSGAAEENKEKSCIEQSKRPISSDEDEQTEFHVSFGDSDEHCFCSCSFWQMHKVPCVHMFAIFTNLKGWSYDMLSPAYRYSNVFTIDFSCLDDSIRGANQINKDWQVAKSNFPDPCDTNITKTKKDMTAVIRVDCQASSSISNISIAESAVNHSKQFLKCFDQLYSLLDDKNLHESIRSEWQRLSTKLQNALKDNSDSSKASTCEIAVSEPQTSGS